MEKVTIAAYTEAAYNMTLDQNREAVASDVRKVAELQASLSHAKARLAGHKEALAEKSAALSKA